MTAASLTSLSVGTSPSAVRSTVLWAAAPLTRDGAAETARRELRKAVYRRDDPSLALRALQAVGRWVDRLFSAAESVGPGGVVGVLLLIALLVLGVLVVRSRLGPLARTASSTRALPADRPRTAAEHRAAAEEAARAGRYAEALRERLRAIAAALEQRGVLEPRPGRTAEELAAEADLALAGQPELRAAARAFDEIWYGGRAAVAADYSTAVDADAATARAPAPAGAAR